METIFDILPALKGEDSYGAPVPVVVKRLFGGFLWLSEQARLSPLYLRTWRKRAPCPAVRSRMCILTQIHTARSHPGLKAGACRAQIRSEAPSSLEKSKAQPCIEGREEEKHLRPKNAPKHTLAIPAAGLHPHEPALAELSQAHHAQR
jgi:hypothetical protein